MASYRSCSVEERQVAIEQLTALIASAQTELVAVLAAGDAEGDWAASGCTSPVAWVAALTRSCQPTARELLRVGHALEELPVLRAAARQGRVGWDVLRAATEFLDPGTEAALVEELLAAPADEVRLVALEHRRITREQAQVDHARAVVRLRRDRDHRGTRLSGWLPADMGARLEHALRRAADARGPDAETGQWAPAEQRYALALDDLAAQALRDDPDPDRTTLVVTVAAASLAGPAPVAVLGDDAFLGADAVARLACSCKVELQVLDESGRCIGVGRTSREPTPPLRRALRRRDRRCRFPGCRRAIRHDHHLRWWSAGGPTDAPNLLGLCWHHHHLVHEGGWTATGDADREVVFRSPTGLTRTSRPPALSDHVRRRASAAASARARDGTSRPPVGPTGAYSPDSSSVTSVTSSAAGTETRSDVP